jgi:hypothetical protein
MSYLCLLILGGIFLFSRNYEAFFLSRKQAGNQHSGTHEINIKMDFREMNIRNVKLVLLI